MCCSSGQSQAINILPVQMAMDAQKLGLTVIGLTAVEYSSKT